MAVCSCPAIVSRDSVYGTQASVCMTQHNCAGAFQPLTLLDLAKHTLSSSERSVYLLLQQLYAGSHFLYHLLYQGRTWCSQARLVTGLL